ncbi:MAG: hypothetical protein HWN65_21005 [Candidatus Helarchaeota archaeon]|nr:hypothetical protein [Candidatus Helarchaeota archaeon]
MVHCVICLSQIGSQFYEAKYVSCRRCGLTFCGRGCASKHICGVTSRNHIEPTNERYFFGIAFCIGMITGIAYTLASYILEALIFWPHGLIPIGFIILVLFLGLRERKLRPMKIDELNARAPACPLCGSIMQFRERWPRESIEDYLHSGKLFDCIPYQPFGGRLMRYYCDRCGKCL